MGYSKSRIMLLVGSITGWCKQGASENSWVDEGREKTPWDEVDTCKVEKGSVEWRFECGGGSVKTMVVPFIVERLQVVHKANGPATVAPQ